MPFLVGVRTCSFGAMPLTDFGQAARWFWCK